MTTDQSAPATKQDVALLMDQMGSYYLQMEARVLQSEKNMKLHFEVIAENLRHDYLSANHDDMENLKTRVTRLERKTGLRR